MLDANQQWTLPTALNICQELNSISPYFIEEPTHPDDIAAHRQLAEVIAPTRIALGEHVANRILFHNFMQAGAVHVVQPDCTRLAGVSEVITVSLLAVNWASRWYPTSATGPDPSAPGLVQPHCAWPRDFVP
jgi:L-fuconate dehydratase